MHDTLFIVLKTKHNLSIFEPEIKNPLSIFEPVGQNEYAYKKKHVGGETKKGGITWKEGLISFPNDTFIVFND